MIVFTAGHTGLPSIVTEPIPAGQPYSLVGVAAGREWLVAEGVGVGVALSVSDPACPLDVVVEYTLTADVSPVDVYERPFFGSRFEDTLLVADGGRSSFSTLWEGDAGSVLDPRASYTQPLARRWASQLRQLSPAAPSFALDCRVEAEQVPAARRVFESGRVWVVHSHVRCSALCTLPTVMLAGVEGTVSEGSWPEGRTYQASLVQLEQGPSGVPVVTWGEAARAGAVWGPGTTFASIRDLVGA